jgi:hypothetical protein
MADPQVAYHIAQQAGTFEPQRQNNFLFEIYGLGGDDKDIINLSIVNAALPSISMDEIEITYGNTKVYVAGPATVETIPLVVRDYVDTNTREALLAWFGLCFNPVTGAIGLAANYKKEGRIVITDPSGGNERSCRLTGCWLQALTHGPLDHTGGDPIQIEGTIRYDMFEWE